MDISWLQSIWSWVSAIAILLLFLIIFNYLFKWIEGISSRDEIKTLRSDIKDEFSSLKNELHGLVGFLDNRYYYLNKSGVEKAEIQQYLRQNNIEYDSKHFVDSDQGLFKLLQDMNSIRNVQLDKYLTTITDEMKITNAKLDRIIEELKRRT
jgi:transcription-repair coupling factor (superfamily II helicase)